MDTISSRGSEGIAWPPVYWLKLSCGGLSKRNGLRYRHMVELQSHV